MLLLISVCRCGAWDTTNLSSLSLALRIERLSCLFAESATTVYEATSLQNPELCDLRYQLRVDASKSVGDSATESYESERIYKTMSAATLFRSALENVCISLEIHLRTLSTDVRDDLSEQATKPSETTWAYRTIFSESPFHMVGVGNRGNGCIDCGNYIPGHSFKECGSETATALGYW